MVIISKTILAKFGRKHPEAVEALNRWLKETREADWATLADMKRTFNSVDYVGNDRYVFDIKGNRYRIVAMVFFDIRTVFIRFVGSHAQYDDIDSAMI